MTVGPVLESGALATALVAAIEKVNRNVKITNEGSYIRVSVPDQCLLDRKLVEGQLGHTFELPGDLEAVMPSFKGNLIITEDHALWRTK